MTTQKSVYMVFDFFCLNSVAMDFYLIVSSPDEGYLPITPEFLRTFGFRP